MKQLKYLMVAAVALSQGFWMRAAGDAVTSAAATDKCLLGLNLLRTAQLSTQVGVLSKDTTTENAAVAAITNGNLAGNDNAACALVASTTPVSSTVVGLLLTFPQTDKLDCTALIQTQLNTALGTLKNYNGAAWNNGAAAPYDSAPVQNLAYAAFAGATKVGCGVTDNCTAGTNVLLCRFSPTIDKDYKQAPFPVDFFKALEDRKASGVDLTKLTDKDVNTKPSGGGGGGGGSGGSSSSGTSVVPASAGLLVVSLLALLSSHA